MTETREPPPILYTRPGVPRVAADPHRVAAQRGTSPLFVLLFYWTFRRVRPEIFELPRLDGAGAFTVWRRVALPLAVPTAVAVAILAFLFYWSDFINPLLYLRSQERFTLPLGLRQLQTLDPGDWPILMAASVVLVTPVVVFFLFLQRRFFDDLRLPDQDGG